MRGRPTSNEASVAVGCERAERHLDLTAGSEPTNAATVSWSVTFDEDVTGVGAADFDLDGPAETGAAITLVSGANAAYTVTASTGVDGSLGLNLVDDDTIEDGVGNPLGGVGTGNGDFTGQAYVIDKSGPTNVLSLVGQATVREARTSMGAASSSTAGTAAGQVGPSSFETP